MYSNHNCPQCSSPIPGDRLLGATVVCACGWSGNKNLLDQKPANPNVKRGIYVVVLALIGFMVFDGYKWGENYPQKLMYSAFSTLKMTGPVDDARFAALCTKLGRHTQARDAWAQAFKKDPTNTKIAAGYGKALIKVKDYESAIMTFQNLFNRTEGTSENMHHYAMALSGGEYIDDANTWFYKSLRSNSSNFVAARDFILHLAKTKNFPEALSVLGHYNRVFPKTRKGWKNMAADLKSQYHAYNSEFKIEEMKISGFDQFLHAPVQFSESSETQVFLVDKESAYLTIDAKYLDSRGIKYDKKGSVSLGATSGKEVTGERIVLPELNVGPFVVKNVKAVACDNCAFLLGKDILKRLNFKEAVTDGIKYITLKQ